MIITITLLKYFLFFDSSKYFQLKSNVKNFQIIDSTKLIFFVKINFLKLIALKKISHHLKLIHISIQEK